MLKILLLCAAKARNRLFIISYKSEADILKTGFAPGKGMKWEKQGKGSDIKEFVHGFGLNVPTKVGKAAGMLIYEDGSRKRKIQTYKKTVIFDTEEHQQKTK